jgi:hypothetical protein
LAGVDERYQIKRENEKIQRDYVERSVAGVTDARRVARAAKDEIDKSEAVEAAKIEGMKEGQRSMTGQVPAIPVVLEAPKPPELIRKPTMGSLTTDDSNHLSFLKFGFGMLE